MGEMADYYRELEEQGWNRKPKQSNEDFTKWRIKNGKKIKVSKMTREHITNTINKIERENWRMEWLVPLQAELNRRNNIILKQNDKNKKR